MHFPALQQYLHHLFLARGASTNIWLDDQGRARGRYFNSTLTSAFQSLHAIQDQRVLAYEGFARSHSEQDAGLSLWRLLDHAANDDESVELDRLCRILHAVNFYRQPLAADLDLYLSVHTRLLAAVEGNHGAAFRRILQILELPHERIVLQLPQITPSQRWVLSHVAENYKRNGFRIALKVDSTEQAISLAERIRPQVLKIDCKQAISQGGLNELLTCTQKLGIRVIFKKLESAEQLDKLQQLSQQTGTEFLVQGYLLDTPRADLLVQGQDQRFAGGDGLGEAA
jgi:EAL domain-containing protein (putative c-di-GMP-specific phosphodiesterase class I)